MKVVTRWCESVGMRLRAVFPREILGPLGIRLYEEM